MPQGALVEMVMVNEMKGEGAEGHPVHLHGQHFHLLGMGKVIHRGGVEGRRGDEGHPVHLHGQHFHLLGIGKVIHWGRGGLRIQRGGGFRGSWCICIQGQQICSSCTGSVTLIQTCSRVLWSYLSRCFLSVIDFFLHVVSQTATRDGSVSSS